MTQFPIKEIDIQLCGTPRLRLIAAATVSRSNAVLTLQVPVMPAWQHRNGAQKNLYSCPEDFSLTGYIFTGCQTILLSKFDLI